MGSLGDATRFHFWPSANAGLLRAVAKTVEGIFVGTRGHCDKIRSIAVGAEANQIAGVTSWTFDTMADALRHRAISVHSAGHRG